MAELLKQEYTLYEGDVTGSRAPLNRPHYYKYSPVTIKKIKSRVNVEQARNARGGITNACKIVV
jgi:hypothetical protein